MPTEMKIRATVNFSLEGEYVNAYLTLTEGEEVLGPPMRIGSIASGIAGREPSVKEGFVALMQTVLTLCADHVQSRSDKTLREQELRDSAAAGRA